MDVAIFGYSSPTADHPQWCDEPPEGLIAALHCPSDEWLRSKESRRGYSTGIPVCILVLKKCKKPDDVLFINAAELFVKGKRQNQLGDGKNETPDHIGKIVSTYQFRTEEDRYSKRVSLERIAEEGYNLNISRYISTSVAEEEIKLEQAQRDLLKFDEEVRKATSAHNMFLRELGLAPLPGGD